MIVVIARSGVGVPEDGVSFRDFYEASGSVRVVGVVVWVVEG